MSKENWESYFKAMQKEDWQSAMTVIRKISQKEKNNPQVSLKMGDLYQRMGDVVNAITAYYNSAWILRSQGFFQKAIAIYKIILRLDPSKSEALDEVKKLMFDLESSKASSAQIPISSAKAPISMEELATHVSELAGFSAIPEIFSGIPEEDAKRILNELESLSFSAGQKVVEEGDSGDSMYIVRSGRARVTAHLLGKEIELAVLEEGDVFGEVAFLTGRPRTAAVIADGPLEVFEISRRYLERIIEMNPVVLSRIEDFYKSRVQDTINKIKS
jgi:cAMP-dependent protein kinase regulator